MHQFDSSKSKSILVKWMTLVSRFPTKSILPLMILVFLSSFSELKAQSPTVDNLQWTATSFQDLVTNETVNVGCQFLTYGSATVNWVQDNGQFITKFKTSKIIGNWSDVNTEGTITYQLSDGPLIGELTLTKNGNQWLGELTIRGGTDNIQLRYTITSVKKL